MTASPFNKIPELEPQCGSWVVIRKADGAVVGEFFNRKTVECINQEKYEVLTALQHLARLNRDAEV